MFALKQEVFNLNLIASFYGRDRIVVSTLRCGRNNPGSNPGHGTFLENGKIRENFTEHRQLNFRPRKTLPDFKLYDSLPLDHLNPLVETSKYLKSRNLKI